MGLGIPSRKRNLEAALDENEETVLDEGGEEYDKFVEPESIVRRPTRKQGRRVSGVYREIIALAKVGRDAKALECVFSRFPTEILKQVACISTIWCTVAYRVLRRRCGGTNPFVRIWMAKPCEHASFMNFNGELHYHSELLTSGDGDDEKLLVPLVETVISFGTKIMEEVYNDEDMKFPLKETVIYGLADNVFTNTDSYWDPFGSFENEWEIPENKSMVGSLFIPKSSYLEIVPFSIPLVRETDETDICDSSMFKEIMNQNYQMEAEDELPSERSIKAVLMFQFLSDNFLQSLTSCADQQDVKLISGLFHTVGFNTNDQHNSLAVGLSFWSKTDDSSCLQISSYAVCMSDSNPEQQFLKIKNQCDMFKTSFVVSYSCCNYESPESQQEAIDNYLRNTDWGEEESWYPQKGSDSFGKRKQWVKKGIQMFRIYLPRVPMIGAVLHDPLILGKHFLEDNSSHLQGPVDLGFLVISYN